MTALPLINAPGSTSPSPETRGVCHTGIWRSNIDAIVLVGGRGSRLRPLTLTTPKPMLPVAGVPLLTHLLARARDAGIDHVVLSTSYRAEAFAAHFGDGSALGLDLDYVTETEPLGTAGGIRNVADRLRGGPVVVFNGDVLAGLDVGALVAAHEASGADVTLHLTEVADPRAFGVVPTDEAGRVTAFLEKTEAPPTNRINAGCYVLAPGVIERIPAGGPVSVERETFPALLADPDTVVAGHLDSSYWLDLGTPADLVTGSCDLVRGRAPSSALPGPPGEALVLHHAAVDAAATVRGGTTIGARSQVAAEAVLESAVLFDDTVVGHGAVVRRSVLGAGVTVDAGAVVEDAVIGDGAMVGPHCELCAGARVWPGVVLPARGVRFSP